MKGPAFSLFASTPDSPWRNRLTAGIALLLLIVLAAFLGLVTPTRRSDLQRRPSTYFTDASGARAVYLVMERCGLRVRPWRRPLSMLPAVSGTNAPTTLVAAGPSRHLSRAEADALLEWVRQGGQLLFFFDRPWLIAGRPQSNEESEEPEDPPDATDDAPSSLPPNPEAHLLGRLGVQTTTEAQREAQTAQFPHPNDETRSLAVHVAAGLDWTGDGRVIGECAGKPVAMAIPHGLGRVVAVADVAFISNGSLGRGDNAVWLAALCAQGRPGPLAFDEYHHGFGEVRSLANLTLGFLSTPWGWMVLQGLAAGGGYALLYRRRMGRVTEPPPPSLQRASNLIDARAGLLEAAHAQSLAAECVVQHLGHQLGSRGGTATDWAEFFRQAAARANDPDRQRRFAELVRCYEACRRGGPEAEAALAPLCRVTGEIQQDISHER
ncbi:MAG TPA: DUF4350 domain-containing protein [Verrucomicrobiota bacterium]|nr:DUF4350 domain-containing protein [Verrucomicrobiota bacterium]HNU52039.1 DUF4350 domain-containing protein [Verrucomicrobiota bacterium]